MGAQYDLYEAKLYQTLNGVQCSNRFYYQQLLGSLDANDLAAAIETQLVPAINVIQCDAVQNVAVEVTNIDLPSDDYDYEGLTGAGDVDDDYNPPFVAFAFKLVRGTKEVRNGAKRIVGVPESFVLDGALDPAKQTAVDTLAGVLDSALQQSSTDAWLPVIARVTGTLAAGYTVEASAAVQSCEFQRISTQNSRKS